MIPDVSHLSDAGFDDVWECTKKPFVASHSNARAVCPSLRNLTDDRVRRLAERGGCMGLNYYDKFLVDGGSKDPEVLWEALIRQARHITDVGGMEILGLGSDFDGIPTNPALPSAEAMPVLWDRLKTAGFTENQLDGIFWGNVMRVYRDALGMPTFRLSSQSPDPVLQNSSRKFCGSIRDRRSRYLRPGARSGQSPWPCGDHRRSLRCRGAACRDR